jgi:hypothetical protein
MRNQYLEGRVPLKTDTEGPDEAAIQVLVRHQGQLLKVGVIWRQQATATNPAAFLVLVNLPDLASRDLKGNHD